MEVLLVMSQFISASSASDRAAPSADGGTNDAPGLLYTSAAPPRPVHSIIPRVRRLKCLDQSPSATVIDEEKNQSVSKLNALLR